MIFEVAEDSRPKTSSSHKTFETHLSSIISNMLIAPVVISSLQNVADNVESTSTTAEVASQIMKELGIAGFGISEAEATTMGAISMAMATAGTAIEINKLHELGPWNPNLDVKPPTILPKSPPSLTSSSTTTITHSAIVFLPYNVRSWTGLTDGLGMPFGPTPTIGEFDVATQLPLGCTIETITLNLGKICVCTTDYWEPLSLAADKTLVDIVTAVSGTSTLRYEKYSSISNLKTNRQQYM